jgi:flagellar basal body L-ring protein FlgH
MTVSTKGGGGNSMENSQSGNDSGTIAAVIKEVLPRNIYVVEAKQAMRLGTKEHDIDLKGKVREHDLTADDSTSTDSLFDVALGVKGPPEVSRNIASNSGNDSEKPKSTEAKP